MRFLPLLSSSARASDWSAFPAVELEWSGRADPGWSRQGSSSQVHALHLKAQPWKGSLVEEALEALGRNLGPDFLVMRADSPASREGLAALLNALEILLEACSGRGVKVALRPAPGSVPGLLDLLRGVKGDAVGFCWDEGVGADLEAIADRLYCAVGSPGVDPRRLQALGYRWNMAIPEEDPVRLAILLEQLEARYPPVLFPSDLSTRRPDMPGASDPQVSLGPTWNRGDA